MHLPSVPVKWDRPFSSRPQPGGFASIQPVWRRQQTQHNGEQFVLRRDAQLLVSTLAIGKGRLQADAQIYGNRFGAEAGENTQGHFLFATGQSRQWIAGREEQFELVERIVVWRALGLIVT